MEFKTSDKERMTVVETPRLILRHHDAADFAASVAIWADPKVTRYIGGTPSTAEESWSRLLRYAGHWALMGFGYWALEEKATGQLIGDLGFADFKRDVHPSFLDRPELGWALGAAWHGKGFATEGARAALAWADAHFPPGKTVCMIAPENTASIRVAEKCGYRVIQPTTYKGGQVILFER